ncbi:MAG: hypothetical protein IJ887_08500 [Prevotella sp.]|nr:hypothetical protein [Prevotella sp.]MBR6190152.1 hypothetical protein [Prevotella sp.]
MKKTYMKPFILLTNVGARQMICNSQPQLLINRNGSVEAGSVESRRGSSIWDDDEEEE